MTTPAITLHSEQHNKFKTLLKTQQFSSLTHWLNELEQQWLINNTDQDYQYNGLLQKAFDPRENTRLETLSLLHKWLEQSPNDYHANLLNAIYWESASARIRTSKTSHYVSDERMIGAFIARDMSIHYYLTACQHTENYALVAQRLLRITSYLGEPGWLADTLTQQALGTHADYRQQVSPELWNEGIAYFCQEGGTHLLETDLSLARVFPVREVSVDSRDYWLHQTLHHRPQDLYARELYLYYHYPRWGGSHDEMWDFLQSPFCTSLPISEQNHLTVMKAWDYLGLNYAFPDADDQQGIAEFKHCFEQLLELELPAKTLALLSCQYAYFLFYYARTESDNDIVWDKSVMEYAYQLLVTATQVDSTFDPTDDSIDTLIAYMDFAKLPDTQGLMKNWLHRSVIWKENQYSLFLASLASRFALYGIEKNSYNDDELLMYAMELESELDCGQMGCNIFENTSEEAGAYFLERMANEGNIRSMACLVDLYNGKLSRRKGLDPSPYLDPIAEQIWFKKAADGGELFSQYNLAVQISDEYGETDIPADIYPQVKAYLYNVMVAEDVSLRLWTAATGRLATLMLFGPSEEDKRYCLDVVLQSLWNDETTKNRSLAAGYYAYSFFNGVGCTANRYLAKVWVDRALEVDSEDSYSADLAKDIYGDTGFLGGISVKRQLSRDEKNIEEQDRLLTFSQEYDENESL